MAGSLHSPVIVAREPSVELFLAHLSRVHSVTDTSLERARHAAGNDPRIDKVLLKLGLVSDRLFAETWAAVTGLARANPREFPKTAVLAELLPPPFLKSAEALPLLVQENTLRLAVVDPLDQFAPGAIRAKTGLQIFTVIAVRSELQSAQADLYPEEVEGTGVQLKKETAVSDLTRLKDLSTEAPVVMLVETIIERAIELKASDIHITAGRTAGRLRYRIDGVLRDATAPSQAVHDALISRLKVLAQLDITERRLPQDGRIKFGVAGKDVDIRIATMPHLEGEGAVLRILDRSAVKLEFSPLGFTSEMQTQLETMFGQPHGIFLVTGPTGSGKTTTLYTALRKMVRPERNIVSVEDPVEYHVDGVAQIQVNRKIGLDFPTALRAILRQDPDVIMIGEIRDPETASIANQAALTGHFVLATLHTNSAAAAPPRLIDMGVEPYLLSSTVRGVLAQRLIRLLCTACSRPLRMSAHVVETLDRLAMAANLSYRSDQLRESVGCSECAGTGYRGRQVIAEFISANESLRQAILRRAAASEIEGLFRDQPLASMVRSGAEKAFSGLTSLSEVLMAIGEMGFR